MKTVNLTDVHDQAFVQQVASESGQDPYSCYQCGNCTAGCPFDFTFDVPVHRLMRLLQMGDKEAILQSRSIWLCATCETCTTRCPCTVDVARIMDVFRHMARREGYVTEKQIKLFYDTFLDSVKRNGRVFETGLLLSYNTRSGRLFNDAELGPKVMKKGKLALRPHRIKGRGEVAKIFKRFMKTQSDMGAQGHTKTGSHTKTGNGAQPHGASDGAAADVPTPQAGHEAAGAQSPDSQQSGNEHGRNEQR